MDDKKDKINNENLDDSAFINNERLDTDLSGMDPQGASKYVLGFITSLKETQKKIIEFNEEKSKWLERINLANNKNKNDLAEKAKEELNKIEEKIKKYKEYESELKIKIPILKEELNNLMITWNDFNPDELIAKLELTLDDNSVDDFIKQETINDELDKLKKDVDNY